MPRLKVEIVIGLLRGGNDQGASLRRDCCWTVPFVITRTVRIKIDLERE